MALSKEERRKRLTEIKEPLELFELYKEHFGEEFPEIGTRSGGLEQDVMFEAIFYDDKVKAVKIPKNRVI
jgi:hypothetical protein|tara:strand:- start:406 stop:615 length:210 start_codon:yes stop_codon:yes gene_type:complete